MEGDRLSKKDEIELAMQQVRRGKNCVPEVFMVLESLTKIAVVCNFTN